MTEIIAPIFNFLLMLMLIWYFGKDSIKGFLVKRSELIEDKIKNAEKEKKIAEELLEFWNKKEKGLKHEISEMSRATLELIETFRKKTLMLANLQANRIREEARLLAESEEKKSLNAIQKEIILSAINRAKEHVRKNFSLEENEKLSLEDLKEIQSV